MAPSPIRQVLAWGLPTVAAFLSYLWYKKRRIGARRDTGGSKPIEEEFPQNAVNSTHQRTNPLDIVEASSVPIPIVSKKLNRSLSGVETVPIDIVYPKELKTSKSSSMVISDEDLDLEIEKIKSMKTFYDSPVNIRFSMSKSPSPIKALNESDALFAAPSSPLIAPIKKESFEHCTVITKQSEQETVAVTSPTSSLKKMAQTDISAVEDEMLLLTVSPDSKDASPAVADEPKQDNTNRQKVHRKNSARDSANHSPSEVMMASSSLSSMSDNHSVRSSDSGKGGSDVATPPSSRTPQLTITSQNLKTSYEFFMPQQFVGKLIGRNGSFVRSIKERCNAYVYVQKSSGTNRLKTLVQVCIVEGTPAEIEMALKMIRERFPLRKYSEITLEQIELAPSVPTVALIPDQLYLKLIEGINNDTVLSCMVAPDHLFMQQPTHPSYPGLSQLMNGMNICYSSTNSPLLPNPIPENTVCAAFSIDVWNRVMVLSTDEETDTSYVKFLDFGGYAYVENDKLRQIRHDFMLLPFQAAECFLSNVKPKSEDGSWPEGAYSLVANTTRGSIVYTQVADYTPDGIPLVLCYVLLHDREVIFLNKKLVEEGFADWVEDEPLIENQAEDPQEPQTSVV